MFIDDRVKLSTHISKKVAERIERYNKHEGQHHPVTINLQADIDQIIIESILFWEKK